MENRGLIFIPDISGFTRFVSEMEIEHSKLIIQELLEVLINANQIGLQVSEIEGDAILFYKFGDAPDLKSLYLQVEKMFCDFHRNLLAYEYRRFCQCKACTSMIGLSLKVITHYGEFTGYEVKNFRKLIGKDIIVAHQLLKNEIKDHEYWLVTNNLLRESAPATLAEWMEWMSSVKKTETGEIPFQYARLSRLKKEITPQLFTELEIPEKVKVLSLTREYDADIIRLFHASGDFHNRGHWMEGVKTVEEVNHFLPRIGMRCRCVFANGESVIYASSYTFHPDRIEFSETDEKKKTAAYYLLEKLGHNRTRLTLDFYLRKNPLGHVLFNITQKRKLERRYSRSLSRLAEFVKEVRVPVSESSLN